MAVPDLLIYWDTAIWGCDMSDNKRSLFDDARKRVAAPSGNDPEASAVGPPRQVPRAAGLPAVAREPSIRTVDRLSYTLTNLYARGQTPVRVKLHERLLSLNIASYSSQVVNVGVVAKLFVRGEFFYVVLDRWPFPDKVGGQLVAKDFYAQPRQLRNRILMSQIGGFIHLFNRYTGEQIQVISDVPENALREQRGLLPIAIEIQSSRPEKTQAQVFYPIALLPVLKDLLEDYWPISEPIVADELSLQAKIRLCSQPIKLGKLQSLVPTDFLSADQHCLMGEMPALCFNNDEVVQLKKITEGEYVVVDSENESPGSTVENEPALRALDDLSINLDFYIGQTSFTLGELKNMQLGQLVKLNIPLDENVTIKSDGRSIGKGEIVGVGDDTTIRIIELFGQS